MLSASSAKPLCIRTADTAWTAALTSVQVAPPSVVRSKSARLLTLPPIQPWVWSGAKKTKRRRALVAVSTALGIVARVQTLLAPADALVVHALVRQAAQRGRARARPRASARAVRMTGAPQLSRRARRP